MAVRKIDLEGHIGPLRGRANGSLDAYYDYLSQNGVWYSDLAKQVATDTGFAGEAANEYLENAARNEHSEWSDEQINSVKNDIAYDLALADLNARLADLNLPGGDGLIDYSITEQYHYREFESNGLSKNAWMGSFFAEFIGSGSWMHGFDPSIDVTQAQIDSAMNDVVNGTVKNGMNAADLFSSLLDRDVLDEIFSNPISSGGWVGSWIDEIVEGIVELAEDGSKAAAEYLLDLFDGLLGSPGNPYPVSKPLADAAGNWLSNKHSPIVFDLNGNGVELVSVSGGEAFDMDNDGFAEVSGWVKPSDGFLVRDLNGNGVIDNQGELVGEDAASTAFAKLAAMDTNGDGKIKGAEITAAKLQIWRDLDQDGKTDAGELKTLSQSGIISALSFHFAPQHAA